jgi:hypothetical protein
MSTRCTFESFDGRLCKRWADRGSLFCFNHHPARNTANGYDGATLHPLARLSDPDDIFDVLRETLNAVRLGRIPPAQAYAVAHLAQVLLKVYDRVRVEHRDAALDRQIIPTLADEESCADTETSLALSLPVEVDPADAPALAPRGAVHVAQHPLLSPAAVAEFNRLATVLNERFESNNRAAAASKPVPGFDSSSVIQNNGHAADASSPSPPNGKAAIATPSPAPTNGKAGAAHP